MGRGTAQAEKRASSVVSELLLDTAIVVDVLRGYPPALQWLEQQESVGVSDIVWLEIIEGAPNRRMEQIALRLLERFERANTTAQDIDWAIQQLLRFHLSHGLDAMDCLIAASSYRLGVPLYTRNLKHFIPLLGELACRPY